MQADTTPGNPFVLMTDPESVWRVLAQSDQLSQLSQRRCHPLDRAVIRSASAELAAFDSKIDRTTIYLPPEESHLPAYVRLFRSPMN